MSEDSKRVYMVEENIEELNLKSEVGQPSIKLDPFNQEGLYIGEVRGKEAIEVNEKILGTGHTVVSE